VGYKDGLDEGKAATLQQGFDEGDRLVDKILGL